MRLRLLFAAGILVFSAQAAPVYYPLSALPCADSVGTFDPLPQAKHDDQVITCVLVTGNDIIPPAYWDIKVIISELVLTKQLRHLKSGSESDSMTGPAADVRKHTSGTPSERSLHNEPCIKIAKNCPAPGLTIHFLGNDYCLPAWFIQDRNFLDEGKSLQSRVFPHTAFEGTTCTENDYQQKIVPRGLVLTMIDSRHIAQNSASEAAPKLKMVPINNSAKQISRRDMNENIVTVICKGIAFAVMEAAKLGVKAFVDMFSSLLKHHRHKHSKGTIVEIAVNETVSDAGPNGTLVALATPTIMPTLFSVD